MSSWTDNDDYCTYQLILCLLVVGLIAAIAFAVVPCCCRTYLAASKESSSPSRSFTFNWPDFASKVWICMLGDGNRPPSSSFIVGRSYLLCLGIWCLNLTLTTWSIIKTGECCRLWLFSTLLLLGALAALILEVLSLLSWSGSPSSLLISGESFLASALIRAFGTFMVFELFTFFCSNINGSASSDSMFYGVSILRS